MVHSAYFLRVLILNDLGLKVSQFKFKNSLLRRSVLYLYLYLVNFLLHNLVRLFHVIHNFSFHFFFNMRVHLYLGMLLSISSWQCLNIKVKVFYFHSTCIVFCISVLFCSSLSFSSLSSNIIIMIVVVVIIIAIVVISYSISFPFSESAIWANN